jgi:hypothetical protein
MKDIIGQEINIDDYVVISILSNYLDLFRVAKINNITISLEKCGKYKYNTILPKTTPMAKINSHYVMVHLLEQ